MRLKSTCVKQRLSGWKQGKPPSPTGQAPLRAGPEPVATSRVKPPGTPAGPQTHVAAIKKRTHRCALRYSASLHQLRACRWRSPSKEGRIAPA